MEKSKSYWDEYKRWLQWNDDGIYGYRSEIDKKGNFKEFYGYVNEQMPRLVEEGRVLLSVADIIRKRLDVLNSPVNGRRLERWDLQTFWKHNFCTADGVFYNPNGNIKIVLDSQHIRGLNPKSPINSLLPSGALELDENRYHSLRIYDSLNGVEFTKEDLKRIKMITPSVKEVKANPIWNVLVPDKSLLDEYIDTIFALGRKREKYNQGNMSISLSKIEEGDFFKENSCATGRFWSIEGFPPCYGEEISIHSNVNGTENVKEIGHFVGATPEAFNQLRGYIPNPKRDDVSYQNIVKNIHTYLDSRTMIQGITKEGLLEVVLNGHNGNSTHYDNNLVRTTPDPLTSIGLVLDSRNIVNGIHTYLNSVTMTKGVTKEGLLKAVQDCYK